MDPYSASPTGKNLFRVTGGTADKPQSYTLQANDEHDKRQWVSAIRSMLAAERKRLGIVVMSDAGRDCVDQNRPLIRATSRSSFRLRRKSSTSSMASISSMSSIDSLSSLYSIASFDLDDSSTLLSITSASSGVSADADADAAATKGSPTLSVTSECFLGVSPNTTVISTSSLQRSPTAETHV